MTRGISRSYEASFLQSYLVLLFIDKKYIPCRRDLEHAGEEESLMLEGDIGGGLIIQRQITIPKDNPKVLQIESCILARNVGAGSGGFSRFAQFSNPYFFPFPIFF